MRPIWKPTLLCGPSSGPDDGASYEEFLTDLAKQSGVDTPSRDDLARVDRKRNKKGSNEEWMTPSDPDARIAKMQDGRTHLAHKAEQKMSGLRSRQE